MANLARFDWLILISYGFIALALASVFTQHIKTEGDFLHANRGLPAWIAGLAIPGMSLGLPVIIALGAAGARYGVQTVHLVSVGALPAIIFAGLVMLPVFAHAKARTIPDFLGMRFGRKTRALSAGLFAAMTVLISAISMCVLARVVLALHLLDQIFYTMGWGVRGIILFTIIASGLLVLGVVLLGGLAGAVYNQALQLLLLIAAFLPLTVLALRKMGGWSGLISALPAGHAHLWKGVVHVGSNPMGLNLIGIGFGLGLVLGAGYWCADFRVVQVALATKSKPRATHSLLIAAAILTLVPLLLITPGLVATALPTPHTLTVVREEGGMIYHDTTIVSREAEAGHGLVPATLNPANGTILLDAEGHPILNYETATPTIMAHVLPAGLLGLALAALLASLVSGMAANVTACNTVLLCDLQPLFTRKQATHAQRPVLARWMTAGHLLVAVLVALVLARAEGVMPLLLFVIAVVNAPLLAVLLLGVFWRRATSSGAFAGVLVGAVTAAVFSCIQFSAHLHPSVQSGAMAVFLQATNSLASGVWIANLAFGISLGTAVLVSLFTTPLPSSNVQDLIFDLGRAGTGKATWLFASAILAVALALNLFLR